MPTHLISVMLRTILVLLLYWKLIILDRYAGDREALKTDYCYFQVAGEALANVLTGQYNPAGRLPNTWPASLDQVPDMIDYTMKERTYRYFTQEPLYPFGYGLYVAHAL